MSLQHHPHSQIFTHSSMHRLWVALGINAVFLLVEIAGGVITHSLALLADAGHMLTDVAALSLALIAAKLTERPSTPEKTFGYLRAEVLGAFINSASLVLISGFIVFEAIKRFAGAQQINGPLMVLIAVFGLAANVGSALVLFKNRKESLNLEGAFLHLAADAFGSLAAIIGGGIIWLFGWTFIDPIVSIVIVLLILYGSWGLLKSTTNVLLEATPVHLDYREIKEALEELEGIDEVHDLHIWTIASGMPSLSAHIRLKDGYAETGQWQTCLAASEELLQNRFQIHHATLQFEPYEYSQVHRICRTNV